MARLKFLAFAGIAMLGGSTVYAQQMPASCNTDPAIVSFKLEKGLSQQYRAVVQVNNLGSNHWQSAPGLQRLLVTFRNARTGNPITQSFDLPTGANAGGSMGIYTTPFIPDAFDTQANPFAPKSMGGSADVRINYGPSVAGDGNPCNDDRNLNNNWRAASQNQVLNFVTSADRFRNY